MIGIAYQILNRIFSHLGQLNDWPPLFSAISPTILFFAAAITLLYLAERR